MSDAPFQMLGLTASRDDRRLVSVSVPWNCKTLGETMTVGGGHPFGLPETGRQVSQLEDGSFQVSITYEGTENELPEDESYEFDSSFREEPIESHPNIALIRSHFGGTTSDDGRITFPERLPRKSTSGAGLSGNESSGAGEKNPMFGQSTYLVLHAVFRRTYLKKKVPKNLLDEAGTTRDKLPGGLPTPKGRNWLVMPPKVSKRGNVFEITEELLLSKPGEKWPPAVYRLIQR
jgi:hypothetical protein